jgi:hypothetical protein
MRCDGSKGLLFLSAILVAVGVTSDASRAATLGNGRISLVFGDRGLTALTDVRIGRTFRVKDDGFRVSVDGGAIESTALKAPHRQAERERVTYRWTSIGYEIDVVYEVKPEWLFVSKQIFIAKAPSQSYRVNEIEAFRMQLTEEVSDSFIPKSARPNLGTADSGVCLRFSDKRGLLATVQNPFLHVEVQRDRFSVRYSPEIEWRADFGPFTTDRALVSPYRLSGRVLPAAMAPEWSVPRRYASAPGMDEAEIAAFTDIVRAFLLYRPTQPLSLTVGWCANDYQIDVADAAGREEYKRLLDRAAELGSRFVLYAPSNSATSRREESVDDWSWEHTLWLGLGQKIRTNQWDIKTGAIPLSVQEMLDYAQGKNLKLLAYVYPVMPFSQNPEWLVTSKTNPARHYANLGIRSFQDWLIDALVTFHQRTGIGGFAFDHTFLTYEGTSPYAQWAGWRRVMEEIRRKIPDVVIDGRQAYQLYGPWSWLAGSYPHPTANDEQPESFVPFPDLHFDRVSANRQRFTAYRYRNYDFAPTEIVPGFITHQTPRSDDTARMPERRTEDRGAVLLPLRARDWDYLGWRYSLLSSIATAGWNNVINMIPARDLEEHRHFSDADRQWFRGWIDWTAKNKEYLRHTRTILGQPALGKIDGTSAIVGDRGFLFLFNPNGARRNAEFVLDSTIGLAASGSFVLKELYPLSGRLVGKPGAGAWATGDRVTIMVDGGSAMVLEVQPASGAGAPPLLFNAPGTAALNGDSLQLSDVRGEVGTTQDLVVLLPQRTAPRTASVNGQAVEVTSRNDRTVSIRVSFEGTAFGRYQPVVSAEPSFQGGHLTGSFTIPGRIVDQLAARRKAWPIPWTPEDFRTPWLVPERLLLFVQIAEPDARWDARLTIDGRTIELKKAYSAIRSAPRTFVGFYADVSMLDADREYRFDLELPPLEPGRLQGVFFENVETEYTDRVKDADGAKGAEGAEGGKGAGSS